jgi:hypothetical protein
MGWNYRVIYDEAALPDGETEGYFTIRETYYDEDGRINSWTAGPCHPQGETWIELGNDLALFERAIGLPIVDVTSGKAVERSMKDMRGKAGFGSSPMGKAERRGYDS